MGSFATECIERNDQPILVVGLGRSGIAASRLLLSKGKDVIAIDTRSNESLERTRRELEQAGTRVFLSCETIPQEQFACAVISPGVSVQSDAVQGLNRLGVRLLPEFELGWSQMNIPTVAVTGSNGKSTAVKWIAESMAAAGLSATIGGNYGTPLSEIALSSPKLDWLVVELSSFQLETHVDFRADIAVLLNLNPNHLDRHGDMREYERIKMRIYENAGRDDFCILPLDMMDSEFLPARPARWSTFGRDAKAQWRFRDGAVRWAPDRDKVWRPQPEASTACGVGDESCADISGTYFGNGVMGITAAAVFAVCHAARVGVKYALGAAIAFKGLPHRMEVLDVDSDLKFINDSKATNISAMKAALEMTDGTIRLIAGGRAKESSFAAASGILRDKVAKVYLIGESSRAMLEQWGAFVECLDCGDLLQAVKKAVREASAGDTIILSPGCASFDQFHSFEERGCFFIKCVKDLEAGSII